VPKRFHKYLLTMDEAAEAIGTSRRTLDRWRSNGLGPPVVRVGSKFVRVDERELAAWLRQARGGRPEPREPRDAAA
jgi:excisionase family DNA binding protein